MDAITVVFNTLIAAVLIIGAFGIAFDVEAPTPEVEAPAAFTKKIDRPVPSSACMQEICLHTAPLPAAFIETKKVVTPPAPVISWGGGGATIVQNPTPATIKHGDDHPSTHSKRGKDRDRDDWKKDLKRAAEQREKAEEEARKLLERAREEAREAAEEWEDRDDDDDDDEDDKDDD